MAVFELDFSLSQGAFTLDIAERSDARALALFGPSGSGKTTIVEAIAGLRTPLRGTIAISGRVLFSRDRHVDVPARERRVGYVPQDVLLFPHLSVRENMMYGASRGRADLTHLSDLLELNELMNRRVMSLSGGERQRVALARALIRKPHLLLCDEPTGNLDRTAAENVASVLLDLHRRAQTILLIVTHSPHLAEKCAIRFELTERRLKRLV